MDQQCPFGQPITVDGSPEWCPAFLKDGFSCQCMWEAIRQSCGAPDDQSAAVCAWWIERTFDYEWPERQLLPGFEEGGDL